jgi:CubicO group peptidase (beta-lactamase class C family)
LPGTVDPAFAPVADVFEDFLASGQETGAAVAAYVGGRRVVDLWGGWADAARTRPWTPDTLVTIFSAGKPLVATCLLRSLDPRDLDSLETPVSRFWPEFAAGDKSTATVRHALAHQAGVPAVAGVLSVAEAFDWDGFAQAIADTPAAWVPGTAHGEHALTYGHLLGEILRRATGTTLDDAVRDLPFDVHFGLSGTDLARVAEVGYGHPGWPARTVGGRGELWSRALGNPAGLLDLDVLNGADWRRGLMPAVTAHASARGLAAFYAALLARDSRVLPRALRDEALAPQAVGPDQLLEEEATWTLGWRRDGGWVGMGGVGGSSAGLDEDRGYSLAYTTRHLDSHDRSDACYDALEACL